MNGIELINQERVEQLTKHGRTVEQDKELNTEFQLADAAGALISPVPAGLESAFLQANQDYPPVGWDKEIWCKMLAKSYKERLIIAGALIAAEIDRIN